ncbi:MAG: flagellar type III secretion system protein FlhB [Beijerinckiaceae bacterium]|nr:flagellar type III secretion system protein FlhB [Beijerinckiaceae bacterium]
MSSENDRDSKTEQASEKKLSDARSKGNIPQSRDATTFVSVLGIFLALFFFGASSSQQVGQNLRRILEQSGDMRIATVYDAQILLVMATNEAFYAVYIIPLIIAISGVLGSISQAVPTLAFARISPKLSKISVLSGLRRLFGFGSLMEFGKTLIKILFLMFLLGHFVLITISDLSGFLYKDVDAFFHEIKSSLHIIIGLALFLYLVVAVIDLVLVRARWNRDLRMTPKEVKDEVKEAEGSPFIKSLRRSISLKRNRTGMLSSIPESTIVLINPTHFSVALRYDRGRDAAPVLLAKGQDLIAMKIREIARSSNVPIIESKLLARALFRSVEVNQVIPVEFYRAVAEIISLLENTARLRSAL